MTIVNGTYRGYVYRIASRKPYSGIGWTFWNQVRPDLQESSSGAFYDDCEDHPEGAYVWAENAVKRRIDTLLATVAEFDAAVERRLAARGGVVRRARAVEGDHG